MHETVKLTLEYDGTDYVGWQTQPNGPSIQATLEGALGRMLESPVRVIGAGRTDAGVHAGGQVATFVPAKALPLKAFVVGINSMLPEDVAVLRAEECDPTFDARRSAVGKRYAYRIVCGPTRAPLAHRFAWELFRGLDTDRMTAAAGRLVGKHDFASFRASDCPSKTSVRELHRVDVKPTTEGVRIEVEGTAFLKHMVRNIVGTLVEVGQGDRSPEDLARVLAAMDRSMAGPTAPARGLCLECVTYPAGHALRAFP